jgi:hypothetical protein
MNRPNWFDEFPGSVTICDPEGIVLDMNDRAAQGFEADGGRDLIGQSMLGCHPEPARSRLVELLKTHQKNVYTIEKKGVWKLVYQTPWFEAGAYRGLIEFVLEIPSEMPHFIRQP